MWRLPLSAFLLRRHVTPYRAFVDPDDTTRRWHRWTNAGLEEISDPAAIDPVVDDVLIASFSHPTSPPPWATFLQEAVDLEIHAPAGTSAGAVVFVSVSDPDDDGPRWIAWAFGGGFRTLNRVRLEPRFGLYAALNRLSRHGSEEDGDNELAVRLRQLQYRTPSPYSLQTGQRAGRDAPLRGFRLDQLVDLISGVGGRTADDDDQVFGARQLRIRRQVASIDDLLSESAEALKDAGAQDYLEEFAFVDSMVAVDGEEEIESVRAQLLAELRDEESDRVDVFYPDDLVDLGDERAVTYIAYRGERRAAHGRTVLTLGMVQTMARNDPDSVLDRPLRFLDAAGDDIGTLPVLACLAADIVVDEQRYVVYDGDIFRVDQQFIDEIDAAVAGMSKSSLAMPGYQSGREDAWNRRLAEQYPDSCVLLDKRLIRPTGQTGFEPCDVISHDGLLVHAKRKGRSSTLSHLFTQAVRSAELLTRDPACQLALFDRINERASGPDLANRVIDRFASLRARPPDLEVCFALLGPWGVRRQLSLPLLAKMDLVNAFQRLDQLGLHPTLALVGADGSLDA